MIAHAIGHRLLHPGNHLLLREHAILANRYEREAEDFAHALLIDAEEALAEGLADSWEIAEYFGVPDELVRQRARALAAGLSPLRPAPPSRRLGGGDA